MNETNELFDSPAMIAEPEIDQRLVAAWLASLRPDERPWWWDVELPETSDEDAFTQALKISISTRRH